MREAERCWLERMGGRALGGARGERPATVQEGCEMGKESRGQLERMVFSIQEVYLQICV